MEKWFRYWDFSILSDLVKIAYEVKKNKIESNKCVGSRQKRNQHRDDKKK